MSLHSFERGRIRDDKPTDLTSTNTTTLMTGGDNGTVVEEILVVNYTGTARTIILDRYDGTTQFNLTGTYSIDSHTVYQLSFPVVLNRGETLRATASAADAFMVHIAAVER